MSRSNTYSFTFTLNSMIQTAFQTCNIYQVEDTISSADYNVAKTLLNSMIKSWEADGVRLWKRRQGILFPQKATASYAMGLTGDNTTNTYVSTTLTSAAATSVTTLILSSTTGMTAGDNIGIELTAGTRQWTTIVSVTNATHLVITTGLTSAAASGLTVVSYTSKINRPMKITRANVFHLTTLAENQVQDISYDEYFDLPLKTTIGRANNYYYDKLLDNGVMYLFPVTNNVKEIVKFTYYDCIMDMVNTTDNFDFPQEWFHPILYGLICELCYAFQKFVELEKYESKANALKTILKQWDGDEETLKIKINNRR